jgi:hypothetical protein
VEVQKIIDELRLWLENVVSEDELLRVITERLAALRQAFSLDRAAFTPDHIAYLKSVGRTAEHLRLFVELRQELAYVGTLDDYREMERRLDDLKDELSPFAVSRRVAKEIRELHERRTAIQIQESAHKLFEVEHGAPNCRCHHPMVLRRGRNGDFWGCSRYPLCTVTASVRRSTPMEVAKLG